MLMLLCFVFLTLTALEPVEGQRGCSRDRLRRCNDRLLRSIQQRIVNMDQSEMLKQCMNVRDDFNCMLRETRCLTSETERNRNGDTLRNALRYLRDGCDTKGTSWSDSSCYIGDSMKTCEKSYPLRSIQSSSYNPESCRKFNLFQDCVMDSMRNNRCSQEDERLLGQYLVDSGQDLAWNCGDNSAVSSTLDSDWDRDDRGTGRYDDRDRYDRNGGDRDRYDRNGGGDRDRYDRNGGDRDRDWDRGRDSSSNSRDRDSRYRGDSYGRDRDGDRYSSDRYDRNGGGSYNRDGSGSDVTCCRSERCSTSRMNQCRDSLTRAVDSRSSGYQDSQKCRQMRDDFNCLLWQTSNCMRSNERDRDNDLFRRAKDFISRNCDTYSRWSENSCYKSTEMQTCENGLTTTRGGATYEACRTYLSFRDCMEDELRRRCTREDDLYQGAYLTDKAQELSWQCGDDHSRYNGRNQYSTDTRRDQYDSNDRYDSSPQHLEDDDALCQVRVQAYDDRCKEEMDEKRRKIHITDDYEERQKISCCSARQYRKCLFDATRRVCQSERPRVVESFMGRFSYELSSDKCRRIYESDCDSANQYRVSMMLMMLCAIVIPTLLHFHF